MQTDAELIFRSVEEPAAFAEIFERHYESIVGYLHRRLTSALAEDQAAETFVIAFRRREEFDHTFSSAKPWLFGIASNLVRSSTRDERLRMSAYSRLPGSTPEPAEASDVDSRLDASAMHDELVDALLALRIEEREVLLLFSWGELSYAEIAEALTIPEGTVRSRLSRARSHILWQLAKTSERIEAP